MGLFDKKYCDVCGEKIGLLGNRKLEDGNLCKNCAKNLSRWFNERRHSSVDEIKAQLAYREENKKKVAQFRKTHMVGDYWNVLFDENNRWFTVTRASSPDTTENPDIIDFSAVMGCDMDVDEDKAEIFYKDTEGNEHSYSPPCYEYSYNFYITLRVNTPYFDEIKFRLNPSTVTYNPVESASGASFRHTMGNRALYAGGMCPEYCNYRDMGEEICSMFAAIQSGGSTRTNTAAFGQTQQAPAAAAVPTPQAAASLWSCASCGTQNSGKFCENCGAQRPALQAACAACGWVVPAGQNKPKFCPECGKPLA